MQERRHSRWRKSPWSRTTTPCGRSSAGSSAQYAQESGHQLDVTAFSDGAQLVEPYRPGFDIIFLDIEMPKLGGMPTAERIRRQDPDVVLVFVTNMAQYAIRGYEVDALDFVLKPVSYYQFSTKLERALQRIQRRRGGQVALQVSGGVQLLDTDDILYLETRDRLCTTTRPRIPGRCAAVC